MIKNIELNEIAERLFDAKSAVLFPHVNPDGDAVGACVGLCCALRQRNIDAWVYSSGPVPGYLQFLNTGVFTDDFNRLSDPDICMAVDCGEDQRIADRLEAFYGGKVKMCIDHHLSKTGYGDHYYIDESAAAVCEIVYDMLKHIGIHFERDIANALYTGLSTDTGNYQYSNTTPHDHEIAAEILRAGVDHTSIMVNLYQNRNLKKVICESRAIDKMLVFAGGKGIVSYLTSAEIAQLDATNEDTDQIIDALRNINGVEMAAYLEERENGIKVSMRAKTYGNVAEICGRNGGGGHVKAAGCTMKMPMEEAYSIIKKEIEEAL